jgi:thiosulfate/3-mercaptopyruvate sulfurtransferase
MRSVTRSCCALLAVIGGYASAAAGQPAGRLTNDDSLIVSPAWLAAHMKDPSLAVVFVASPRDTGSAGFAQHHIPGAQPFELMKVMTLPLTDGLPPADQMSALLEQVGVSTNTTVVLYGSALPRFFVILKYLGIRAKVLDGGLARWTAEGRPVSNQMQAVAPGHISPTLHREFVVDANWVQAHLNTKKVVLLDTRTTEEYEGGAEGPRNTKGHIPGAIRIAVEEIGSAGPPSGEFKLNPIDQVRRLYSDRAQPGDTIVTYCTVGNRASTSFLMALQLGYPARIYLGSYQDWAARGLPLVAGGKP